MVEKLPDAMRKRAAMTRAWTTIVSRPTSLSPAHLDSGPRGLFSVDLLRPKQRAAVKAIVFGRESIGKVIAVDRT